MIQHVWTVLCRYALTDGESKNATLVECVGQLQCPKPAIPEGVVGVQVPANLWVVTYLVQERVGVGATGQLRLRIITPTGKDVLSAPGNVAVPETGGAVVRTQLGFHPVNLEGRYWHVLEFADAKQPDRWREVVRYPVDISFLPPDSVEG